MDATNLKVYLPFDTSATEDLTGGTWTATSDLEIENHALKFYAFVQSVKRSGGIILGGKDFTISSKFNMRTLSEGYAHLFSIHQTSGTQNNKIGIDRNNNSTTALRIIAAGSGKSFSCSLDATHHIEIDYLHSLSKLLVFVDGALAYTLNNYTLAETNFANCWLGKSNYDNDSSFIGSIDEFIIYDGVALHDANFTPPTADEYNELKLALGAPAYFTTEFDVETRVHNGLKGWRYYNPGYGDRLKTGGTTIQTDRSVTGVAFYGGGQSDMFWTPDGLKEIWMRFDFLAADGAIEKQTNQKFVTVRFGQNLQLNGILYGGYCANESGRTVTNPNKIYLPDSKIIYMNIGVANRCLLHMVSDATSGLFELTLDGVTYRYTGNINGGEDFNNLYLFSDMTANLMNNTKSNLVLFANVVISQTPITLEDGWHVDSVDVESKIIAPVLNLRARGETHKFKLHTKKSKPANAISVAGRKFYGKYIATTDDNAGVIRVRYDDADYALSKT